MNFWDKYFSHPYHPIYGIEPKYLLGCGHPWSHIKVRYFLLRSRDCGSPWSVFYVFTCSFSSTPSWYPCPLTARGKNMGEHCCTGSGGVPLPGLLLPWWEPAGAKYCSLCVPSHAKSDTVFPSKKVPILHLDEFGLLVLE